MKSNKVNSLFRSTTVRLTAWYILILMSISLIFSLVIYQVAYVEVETRLNRFQTNLQSPNNSTFHNMFAVELREEELHKAQSNLTIGLFYVNIFIFITGGFASYYLAKWHLIPIEKAHEAQSRFTSDASHELRTPLAAMKTEIEVTLRDSQATNDELREVLSSNLEEVDKLTRLSEMLLNLSRLDSAKLELKPINFTKITRTVLKDFSSHQDRLELKLNKQIIINGNETAIFDLIKILVDNALLYSPKDSKVQISISKIDNCAIFETKNGGPGISASKISHIFDRFYRADSSRTNGDNKGYGLGLALAKSIVDLHNGEIIVESITNEETTFKTIIPIYSKKQIEKS